MQYRNMTGFKFEKNIAFHVIMSQCAVLHMLLWDKLFLNTPHFISLHANVTDYSQK